MSYPSCKHGHCHEMIPCPTCDAENQVDTLFAERDTALAENAELKSKLNKMHAASDERDDAIIAETRSESDKAISELKAKLEVAEKALEHIYEEKWPYDGEVQNVAHDALSALRQQPQGTEK